MAYIDLRYSPDGYPKAAEGTDYSGFEALIWATNDQDTTVAAALPSAEVTEPGPVEPSDPQGDTEQALETWQRTVRQEKEEEAKHPQKKPAEVERAATKALNSRSKQSKNQSLGPVELTAENDTALQFILDTLPRSWLHHREERHAGTQRGLDFMRAITLLFRFKDIAVDTSYVRLESKLDAEVDLKRIGGMAQLFEMAVRAGFLKRVKRSGNDGYAATSDAFIKLPKEIPLGQRSPTLDLELTRNFAKLGPTTQSEMDRKRIVSTIQSHLGRHLPEAGFVVELFGSSGSGLYTPASDSDLCCYHGIYPPQRRIGIWDVKRALDRCRDFTDIIAISHAKIPIVKMRHVPTNLAVDVSIENTVAIENTRLLQLYADCDARVKPLLFALKTWCKSRAIAHPEQGSLSSYSWVLLMIHYLQRTDPPVVPNVQYQPTFETFHHAAESKVINCFYSAAIGKRWSSTNTRPLGELLHGFFRYYHEYDFATKVVDIRGRLAGHPTHDSPCLQSPYHMPKSMDPDQTGLLTRAIKIKQYGGRDWHHQNKLIAIQDPFIDERNTAVGCHDVQAEWIMDEITRAYRLLSAGGTFGDIVFFNKR